MAFPSFICSQFTFLPQSILTVMDRSKSWHSIIWR